MNLTQHLSELRRRIIVCLLAAGAAALLCLFFADDLLTMLSAPVGVMVFLRPAEAFTVRIKLSAYAGLFLSMPVLFHQLWLFIAPGLLQRERKGLLKTVSFSCLLFISGAAFAFFIVLPATVKYLLGFSGPGLLLMISVSEYVSFAAGFILAFGLAFQLPVVIVFLTAAGLVGPTLLRRQRRYVVLGIFILAGVLTPPDVYSQVLLALPMLLLYEAGILLSVATERLSAGHGRCRAGRDSILRCVK